MDDKIKMADPETKLKEAMETVEKEVKIEQGTEKSELIMMRDYVPLFKETIRAKTLAKFNGGTHRTWCPDG